MNKWSNIAKLAVSAARECRKNAMREPELRRNHLTHREVEVIAFSDKEGRHGEPEFLRVGELSGAKIHAAVRHLLSDNPRATNVSIDGALDAWETFWEFANQRNGYDYTPRVAEWSVDVNPEMIAAVRAEKQ